MFSWAAEHYIFLAISYSLCVFVCLCDLWTFIRDIVSVYIVEHLNIHYFRRELLFRLLTCANKVFIEF